VYQGLKSNPSLTRISPIFANRDEKSHAHFGNSVKNHK
jgi:hypothetical protein